LNRLLIICLFVFLIFSSTVFAQSPPPAVLTIIGGSGQTAKVRGPFPLPLQVSLTDDSGDPITTVLVTFTSPATGAGLSSNPVVAITNGAGIATLNATANGTVGTYTLVASYPGAPSVNFTLTNGAADPGGVVATAGTPQATSVGTLFPNRLEVVVKDEFGNLVSGAPVTFTSIRTGNARALFPDGDTVTTDTDGKASIQARANSRPGSYIVRASSGSATPATFNLTNTTATTFFVPALGSGNASQVGIAWTNPLDKSVVLTLTARTYTGDLISGSGIQNPGQMTIGARGQLARLATEIFGAGIEGRTGWIEVKVSDAGGSGFFLLFDNQLTTSDGALLIDHSAQRLFFPHVNKDTILHVINTTDAGLNPAAVTMYGNNGSVIATGIVAIPARGGFTGRITDLLPGTAGAEGYVIFDTRGSPFASPRLALAGVATYQTGGDSAVEVGQDETTPVTTGYVVHVIAGGGYGTRLKLVNLSSNTQNVLLTFNGLTVQRSILGNGRLDESLDQIFNIGANAVATGYLRITADGVGVVGFVELNSSSGRLLTTEAISVEADLQHVFSQLAQGNGYWTGLALYNPETGTAIITLEVNSPTGANIASRTLTIGSDQRVTGLLSDFFPNLGDQSAGSVRVVSDRGIYSLEIISSAAGSPANFMANIPQAIY